MKRRDFLKSAAAGAATIGLPAAGLALPEPADPFVAAGAEVTRLRIGTHRTTELREAKRHMREAGNQQLPPDPPDDGNNYWAEAIRLDDRYYYRVGDVIVPITEYEYRMVIGNPNLYYFSSALKLHYRINRARQGKSLLL